MQEAGPMSRVSLSTWGSMRSAMDAQHDSEMEELGLNGDRVH